MKTLLTIGYRGRSLAWLLRQLRLDLFGEGGA